VIEKLTELRDLLDSRANRLEQMSFKQYSKTEAARLAGKAEGVRLARSFVDDVIRQERAVQFDRDLSREAKRVDI
jgi:hypothetical protein